MLEACAMLLKVRGICEIQNHSKNMRVALGGHDLHAIRRVVLAGHHLGATGILPVLTRVHATSPATVGML
jgi:hypothetical protein